MSGPNNHSIADRRIGILKRRIETTLMELTEVEVLINARVPSNQVGDDELVDARQVLTTLIIAMDAELKQLRLTRGETAGCDGRVISFDVGGHSEILGGVDALKRREDGRVPAEREGSEVALLKSAKPHVRSLTVESAPLERADCRPAAN